MLATINVKNSSSFAKYNGKIFNVEVDKMIAVRGKLVIPIKGINPEFPDNYTDFTQDELLFCQLENN